MPFIPDVKVKGKLAKSSAVAVYSLIRLHQTL